jgi:predicted SnoaL-like aldol condensation-catalyzing enzyme
MSIDTIRPAHRRLRVLTAGLLVAVVALFSHLPAAQVRAEGQDPTGRAEGARCQEERNREVVHNALQVVFSEHRIDEIDRFYADDFVQHSPYAQPGGRDELKEWWAGIVYAVPDISTTTTQTVVKCADVVTFRTVTGTIVHDLPDLGIVGRGQHLEFRTADRFRVRDGKITEHWEVVDTGPMVTLAHAG